MSFEFRIQNSEFRIGKPPHASRGELSESEMRLAFHSFLERYEITGGGIIQYPARWFGRGSANSRDGAWRVRLRVHGSLSGVPERRVRRGIEGVTHASQLDLRLYLPVGEMTGAAIVSRVVPVRFLEGI